MIITRMRIVIGLLLKWSFCVIPVIHSGADAVARELTFRETASLVSTYLDESLEMAGYETPRLLIALPGDRIPDGCISREGVREIWGSHYCPKTMTVVLEVYELETMRREFGDGAIAYAIAHEYAHYLQHMRGSRYSDPYHELHADCWASSLLLSSSKSVLALGISQRDFVEMLGAVYSVGGGSVHGSSKQRLAAFQHGFGGMFACDNAFLFALAAPPESTPSASQEAMNDMALAAAVNVCELAVEEKLPVQKSVLSTAKAMTYVVSNVYGSQVAGAGRLTAEQIANGSIIQVVGRVRQGCYDKLTAADKKFIDDILSEYNNAVQPQGQNRSR